MGARFLAADLAFAGRVRHDVGNLNAMIGLSFVI